MIPKRYSLILIGVIIALLLGVAEWTGVPQSGDRLFQDHLFRNQVNTDKSEEILIIAIDERSLSHFGEQRVFWPWPREFYAVVIDYLNQNGAKAILIDILLDTPDFDRLSYPGEVSDQRFTEAMKRSDNVILSLKTGAFHSDIPQPQIPEILPEPIEIPECGLQTSSNMFVSLPYPEFIASSSLLGDTNINPGVDGLIRSQRLVSYVEGYGYIPSLSLAGYLSYQEGNGEISCTKEHLIIGGNKIPVSENFEYLINWNGRGGSENGSFTYFSYHQVMQDAIGSFLSEEYKAKIEPDIFQDKMVLIGANAAGLADIKNTPVSSLADFPGVEIHATTLQNLLDQSYIRDLPFVISLFIVFLISMGYVFLFGYNRIRWSTILLFISIPAVPLCSSVIFYNYQIRLPVTSLISTFVLVYTGSMVYNYFTEEKERKKINRAFNQYVQPQVVDEILANPNKLKLGGEKKKISVLFSDLEGFTTISESLDPERLISFLNVYLDSLSNIVLENEGTIDKYIGDAIMAFWGAPLNVENDAEKACKSALKMTTKMTELKDHFKDSIHFNLFTRFGINTGKVVVGNIGSQSRFDYTVLGDSVNLAARLESANKFFGTKIIISEFTRRELSEHFICRKLDLIRVKGKTEPVEIFELLGYLDDDVDYSKELRALAVFNNGLNFYYQKEWTSAIAEFKKVMEIIADDGPAQVYIKRCKDYKQNPPGQSWQGVFEMKTK